MSAGDGGTAAAAAILALAEAELELVARGRVEELADLHARHRDAMATLPAALSGPARASLRHAVALREQVTARLREQLADTGRELSRLRGVRTAARGYQPAGAPRGRVLDRTA